MQAHWANTASTAQLRAAFMRHVLAVAPAMESLLRGESVLLPVDEGMTMLDLQSDPNASWSLAYFSGYLTGRWQGSRMVPLKVPNREVHEVFSAMFDRWQADAPVSPARHHPFVAALLAGDAEAIQRYFRELLLEHASAHDTARHPEIAYHMFALGLLVVLRDTHEVRSNREAGEGRFDVQIRPKQPQHSVVVIEFKSARPRSLEAAAHAALQQIQSRDYARDLVSCGASPIHLVAVVASGKNVKCAVETMRVAPLCQ